MLNTIFRVFSHRKLLRIFFVFQLHRLLIKLRALADRITVELTLLQLHPLIAPLSLSLAERSLVLLVCVTERDYCWECGSGKSGTEHEVEGDARCCSISAITLSYLRDICCNEWRCCTNRGCGRGSEVRFKYHQKPQPHELPRSQLVRV